MEIFSNIWDWLCGFLSDCLEWLIDWLPDSPFNMIDNSAVEPYLKWLNWFIPMDFILNTLSLWLVAVTGYYVWSVVLRFVKAVD